MLLDSKKSELLEMNEELKKLEERFYYEKSNLSLEKKIEGLKKDIAKLTGEISILEKITDLEKRYNNDEPIIYSYNDDGETDDILLTSNDVNYERAYFQQKSLLELEYAYYNKQPIKYNRGTVIAFGDDSYDEFYQKKKQELLNLEIDKRAKDSIKPYAGKHFKSDKISNPVKKEDTSEEFMPYMGGHFKPNDLDMEYAVFKKDGKLYVVGNFTSEWLRKNFDKLDCQLLKNSNIKEIILWTCIGYGVTPLDGMDINVELSKDGQLKIIGDVDAIEYHNNSISDEKKKGAHFSKNEDLSDKKEDDEKVSEDFEKDDSGLDIIPDMPDLEKGEDLSHGAEPISKNEDLSDKKEDDEKVSEDFEKDDSGVDIIPDMPDLEKGEDLSYGAEPMKSSIRKKVKRRRFLPSLAEKFKNLKTWQKALVVAGVIAVVGIGLFAVGTAITGGLNNVVENAGLVNSMSNQVSNTVGDMVNTTANSASALDFSSIGEGHTVFTNAYDAANNANGVISNQWFNSNPVDVFNTATHSYMGLTPEQLANPEFMAELAKDPNNALLFGNSISDPSGFVSLDDIIKEITKGGMMR